MEIVVHSKKSVSTKVSKEIVPCQQEFPILECDAKMIQLDFRNRSRTKKSESDSKCCWESNQKPPTLQPWFRPNGFGDLKSPVNYIKQLAS